MKTTSKWYNGKGSGGQGLVIEEETGRSIAVAYDEKDTPLLAAAPALLDALHAVVDALETFREGNAWESSDEKALYEGRTAIQLVEYFQDKIK